LKKKRFNGIARALIEARIKIATQPIFLVCIIPDYFKKLGFKIVTQYPAEIADKLNYCNAELMVPEPYVVMKFVGNKV
jgi:N-acetylglutamate synthase-like GNAT family acetyltransferase